MSTRTNLKLASLRKEGSVKVYCPSCQDDMLPTAKVEALEGSRVKMTCTCGHESLWLKPPSEAVGLYIPLRS